MKDREAAGKDGWKKLWFYLGLVLKYSIRVVQLLQILEMQKDVSIGGWLKNVNFYSFSIMSIVKTACKTVGNGDASFGNKDLLYGKIDFHPPGAGISYVQHVEIFLSGGSLDFNIPASSLIWHTGVLIFLSCNEKFMPFTEGNNLYQKCKNPHFKITFVGAVQPFLF